MRSLFQFPLLLLLLPAVTQAAGLKDLLIPPQGVIHDPAAFDRIERIVVVKGQSPHPRASESLLSRFESALAGFECWQLVRHDRAAKVLGMDPGNAPAPSGDQMPWSIRGKLKIKDPGTGVLIMWVTWETVTPKKLDVAYAGKHVSVGYDEEEQRRDPGRKGVFLKAVGKDFFDHDVKAVLYSAETGAAIWSAEKSDRRRVDFYEVTMNGIESEEQDLQMVAKYFREALTRPSGRAETCRPRPALASRRPDSDPVPENDPLFAADPAARGKAAKALGTPGNADAVPRLLKALKDPDIRVRAIAADSLGMIGSEDAAEGLRSALDDGNALLRAVAARALGRIGDPWAKERLQKLAAQDPDPRVRTASAEAVKSLRDPAALPDIGGLLKP